MRWEWLLIPGFFVAFAALWLLVTSLLARFSGWLELAERFPDREDAIVERLRGQSGTFGKGSVLNPWGGVSYNRCLNIDVCMSGLRLSIWRIFGRNCRPIFVPWSEIAVQPGKVMALRYFRLRFGDGDLSRLTLSDRTFQRIAGHGLLRLP